jgi:formylglycine-generating enzyme required for sulfatase activity
MKIRPLDLLVFLAILVVPVQAQVPQLLNYQGRVAVGNPAINFDGSGLFKFALVHGTGPTLLWKNDGSPGNTEPTAAVTIPVTKGLYSVLLGDPSLTNMVAIPTSVFGNDDVRLRVWFDDGTNGSQLLTPDKRLAAVGYAMMAGGLAPGATIPASALTGLIPASQVATPPPGMMLIPAGEFTMGNSIAADTDIADAAPVTTTVSAFYMDVNEVTLSQWQTVQQWATLVGGYTDLAAGSGKGPNHPVQTVTWYDCVKWCNARSEREGKMPVYYTDDEQTQVYRTGNVNVTNLQVKWTENGYRLPTEAESERAARGGLPGKRFPWGDTISQKQANYSGSTGSYVYDQGPNGYNAIGNVGGTSPATSPVGSFAANGYGLNDMAGNVLEWCWDWYESPYAGGSDPRGPTSGSLRVLRGGSWNYGAFIARCADRGISAPTNALSYFGFRAVLPPGQP